MSSQAPSSTQGSEKTLSTPPSPSNKSTSSNRDLTGRQILEAMRQLRPQGIYYAGDEIDDQQYDFVYNNALRGDILIPKEPHPDISEFILTGVFEVDGRNFFMTSDGKWVAGNAIKTQLHQVKPSCLLVPVRRNEDFSFSSNDFPSVIGNIHAIESFANPRKSKEDASIVVNEIGGSPAIKIVHHLFVVRSFTF